MEPWKLRMYFDYVHHMYDAPHETPRVLRDGIPVEHYAAAEQALQDQQRREADQREAARAQRLALRPLEYLSRDDRALFESVHDSDDQKDVIITRLLWKIARARYGAHRASKY